MATKAEQIVDSGSLPVEWQAEADQMVDNIKTAYEEVANLEGVQVQAIRFQRDELGNTILGEDQTPELVALTDEQGNAVLEDHPLVHRAKNFGLHNYRYEPCSDGSIVAVYVKGENAEVRMKAFETIEEASLWSPREEDGS